MKEFFARLNSMERRFVLAVIVVVFLIINVLFVWPRFNDWNEMKIRLNKSAKTLSDRQKVITQAELLKPKIAELEREGSMVPPEDQVGEFQRTLNSQAAESGVEITSSATVRQTGFTNAYFSEQVLSINTVSGESQLVDFLYKLGAGNSLIRVRDMSLNPDVPHYKLISNLKLVASFQKKIAVRSTAPATNAPAATPAKPAGSPAPPPNPMKKKL